MKKISLLCRFVLFFLTIFFVGCASTVKIDASTKSKLDDGIAIMPAVKQADTPYYHGPAQTWGMALGGAVGGAIVSSMASEPAKIKSYLETEKIDIGAIVLEEFKRQLNEQADFSGKVRDDGKYHIELSVPMYGITQKNGFSSEYKPILRVRSRMIAPDGNVVWESADYVGPLNSETPAFTYQEYFGTPGTFRNAFVSASKAVVKLLMSDLK